MKPKCNLRPPKEARDTDDWSTAEALEMSTCLLNRGHLGPHVATIRDGDFIEWEFREAKPRPVDVDGRFICDNPPCDICDCLNTTIYGASTIKEMYGELDIPTEPDERQLHFAW